MTNRSNRARDITPTNPLLEDAGSVPMDRIDRNTGEVIDRKAETVGHARRADAQSTGRAGGKQTNSNSSSSNSSSQGGDDKSSGDTNSSSQRVTAGTFDEFSSALLRYGGTGNGREADVAKATNASEAFWAGKGGKPPHPTDEKLCRKIIGIHLKRMANEVNLDAAKAEVKAAIDQSFNGL